MSTTYTSQSAALNADNQENEKPSAVTTETAVNVTASAKALAEFEEHQAAIEKLKPILVLTFEAAIAENQVKLDLP